MKEKKVNENSDYTKTETIYIDFNLYIKFFMNIWVEGEGIENVILAIVDRTQQNYFVIVIESLIKWKQKKNCFAKWRFHFSEVLESWFIRKYIAFFCLLNQLLFYLLEKDCVYVSIYVSVCGWACIYLMSMYNLWVLENSWRIMAE